MRPARYSRELEVHTYDLVSLAGACKHTIIVDSGNHITFVTSLMRFENNKNLGANVSILGDRSGIKPFDLLDLAVELDHATHSPIILVRNVGEPKDTQLTAPKESLDANVHHARLMCIGEVQPFQGLNVTISQPLGGAPVITICVNASLLANYELNALFYLYVNSKCPASPSASGSAPLLASWALQPTNVEKLIAGFAVVMKNHHGPINLENAMMSQRKGLPYLICLYRPTAFLRTRP